MAHNKENKICLVPDKEPYPQLNSFGAIITCFARIPKDKSKENDSRQTYCYRPKGHPGTCSYDIQPEDYEILAKKKKRA